MLKEKLFKIWRLALPFLFLFFLIHFLKDITQDVLKISSFLDIFGDVKEDLSGLPTELQQLFYLLGIGSLFIEVFLLISIPIVLKRKSASGLELIVVVATIFLFLFFAWATLLDPELKNRYFYRNEGKRINSCIKEGEEGNYFDGDECCENLKAVVALVIIEDETALDYAERCTVSGAGGTFLCTKCGNGVCEEIEDVCNCPEDCFNSK